MSLQGAKESNEEQIEIFADLKSKIGNSLFPFRKIGNFKITKRGYQNGPRNHVPSGFPPVSKAEIQITLARPYLHEGNKLGMGAEHTPVLYPKTPHPLGVLSDSLL